MKKYVSLLLPVLGLLLYGNIATAQRIDVTDTRRNTLPARATPWQYINESDMLWRKVVYREINISDPCSKVFRVDNTIPRNSIFANLLLDGALAGRYAIYKGVDNDLVHPLTKADVLSMIENKAGENTYPFNSPVYPSQIIRFRLKEEWIFDKAQGQMVVWIRSIAPVKLFTAPDGNSISQPLFWFAYPDLRNYLANFEPYGQPKDSIYTWDEYFESRQFCSKITQIDGPMNDIIIDNEHRERKHRKKKK